MVETAMVAELVMSPEPKGLVTARTVDSRKADKILSIKESIA